MKDNQMEKYNLLQLDTKTAHLIVLLKLWAQHIRDMFGNKNLLTFVAIMFLGNGVAQEDDSFQCDTIHYEDFFGILREIDCNTTDSSLTSEKFRDFVKIYNTINLATPKLGYADSKDSLLVIGFTQFFLESVEPKLGILYDYKYSKGFSKYLEELNIRLGGDMNCRDSYVIDEIIYFYKPENE